MESLLINYLSAVPRPAHLADELEPYIKACLGQSYQVCSLE